MVVAILGDFQARLAAGEPQPLVLAVFQAVVRGPEQAGPFGWNFIPGSMEGPWDLIIKLDEEDQRNRLNASLFTTGIKRELSGCKFGVTYEGRLNHKAVEFVTKSFISDLLY